MLTPSVRSPRKQRRSDDMKLSSDSSSPESTSNTSSDSASNRSQKNVSVDDTASKEETFSPPPEETQDEGLKDQDAKVAAYLQGLNDISYGAIEHLISQLVKSKDRLFFPSSYQKSEGIEKYILRLKKQGFLPDHRVDAVEDKAVFVGQKWPSSSESSRGKAMETAKRVERQLSRRLHVANMKISETPGPIRRRYGFFDKGAGGRSDGFR